jgi:hypothetical protein
MSRQAHAIEEKQQEDSGQGYERRDLRCLTAHGKDARQQYRGKQEHNEAISEDTSEHPSALTVAIAYCNTSDVALQRILR